MRRLTDEELFASLDGDAGTEERRIEILDCRGNGTLLLRGVIDLASYTSRYGLDVQHRPSESQPTWNEWRGASWMEGAGDSFHTDGSQGTATLRDDGVIEVHAHDGKWCAYILPAGADWPQNAPLLLCPDSISQRPA